MESLRNIHVCCNMADSLTYKLDVHMFLSRSGHHCPVVRRLISADPGLIFFLPGFLFLLFKSSFQENFLSSC